MHPSARLFNAGIRLSTGRLQPRNTPFPLLNTLLPSVSSTPSSRPTRRRQSKLAPSGPQPATPVPSAPHKASIPILARPFGFGILQLTRYASAMLPCLYALSVPGLADIYGNVESAAFFTASFLPLLFVRWASAPYVYAAEWVLPQGIRGREAVKMHLARAPIGELGDLAVRRLGGGGKVSGMGGSWAKIGGKWQQVRIADLVRRRERAGCVDYTDRSGQVKFYFGSGTGGVREKWMLQELLKRVPDAEK